MAEKRFSKEHVWVETTGDVATIGITGRFLDGGAEIVMVRLPRPGKILKRGELAAEVETLKAASEIYTPLSGEVLEANAELAKTPKLASESPLDTGWLFRLKIADPAELSTLSDSDR